MKFFREHRGIVAALIISGAVIVAGVLITLDAPIRVTEKAVASPTNEIARSVAETDSDGDGLFDWEESLWGTDPQKVDSDGDGVLDGDQIRGRAQAQIAEGNFGLPASAPETYTETFAREFFGSYLELRSKGINPTTQQAISELLRTLPTYLNPEYGKGVSQGALNVVEGTPDAYRNYFAGLENIILTPTPEGLEEGELVILEKALRLQSETELAKLDRIAEAYRASERALIALPVPNTLVVEHQNLIRGVQTLGIQIDQFSEVYKDPLVTIGTLEAYQNGADQMLGSIVDLLDTASDFGFDLQPGEKGYVTLMTLYEAYPQ